MPAGNLSHVRVASGVALIRVLHLAIRDGLKGLSLRRDPLNPGRRCRD